MDAWLLRHTTACVAVLVEDAEASRRTSTGMAFWKPGAERPGTWERRATHANTASALDRAGESLALDPGIGASTSALPVAGVREPFLYLVERHGVVIVVGHTGCGKTTRASGVAGADTELPQYLMAAGWAAEGRRIACTQPRRVAATSIAARVAEERGHHLGDDIGYAIRFEDCTHPTRTRLVYTTPGLLFRECLRDPLLSRYSVVLVDEAHERGAYTDMLLAVLKKIRRRRPEFRVIVASATLDAEVFARYFDPAFGTADATAAILSIPGTMHPVELAYAAAPVRDYVTAAIDAVWSIHLREPPGDVLVFMTGREEIDAASQALADRVAQLPRGALTLHILPLHAALSVGEQAAAFAPSPRGTRKVVVATNVAETSLTIDGIRYVVDTGYTKTRLIDAATGIDVLAVVPASQASAAQRAGRAGRTAPGKCFRLYPEAQLAKQRVSDAPELVRCDVTPYVLQLKALGIDNIARFDFVPPAPPAALIARALEYLVCVQALDSEGRLQRLGERLAEAPLDPMMARALLVAAQCGCADEMLSIAAMTAVASPFRAHEFGPTMDVAAEVGRRKFVAEEGDHLTLLNVYDAFVDPRIGQCSARWAASHALDVSVLRRAQAIRAQLVRYATLHWQLPLQRMGDATRLRRCLAAGFFKNAARAMPDGTYQSVHGTALHIHPSSVLFTRRTAAWVVYGELVHTSKPMIRDVCVVERDWLVEAAPHYYEKRQRY